MSLIPNNQQKENNRILLNIEEKHQKELDRRVRFFKLFKRLNREMNHLIMDRGSSFGILVDTDKEALEYQSKAMRFEIVEAYLEGRNPNWYHAPYLDNVEKERRNNSYERK